MSELLEELQGQSESRRCWHVQVRSRSFHTILARRFQPRRRIAVVGRYAGRLLEGGSSPDVQPAPESPMISEYVDHYTFSTNFIIHFLPISLYIFHPYQCHAHGHRGRTQGAGRPRRALWNTSPIAAHGLHGLAHLPWHVLVPMRWSSAKRGRGTATVPVTACKKSAAPVGLRTCVELRCGRNSLSGGRPSPGAWRRRAR